MLKISTKDIAICMATYNGERYIAQQIDSILNQSYSHWFLFIRDDGSTDTTLQIINEYKKKYPDKIFIISDCFPSNSGSKKNFAYTLQWVKSHYDFSYFMFSDQDDVWLTQKIEQCIKKMRIKERIKKVPILVHTDLNVVDQNLNLIGNSFFKYRALDPSVKDLNHLLVQNNITGCTMLWNKELNDLLNLDNDSIAMHDWWMTLTASCFGEITVVSAPTILYRQHENNVVGATKVNTLSFIWKRLCGSSHVREVIEMSVIQANAFLDYYQNELTQTQTETIQQYAHILHHNKLSRILIAIKNNYLKQGIVQIIGELMFL